MQAIQSDATGDISEDIPVHPGMILDIYIAADDDSDAPTGGTLAVQHYDSTLDHALPAYDDAGNALTITFDGNPKGWQKTIVAHGDALRLVGTSLGSLSRAYISILGI